MSVLSILESVLCHCDKTPLSLLNVYVLTEKTSRLFFEAQKLVSKEVCSPRHQHVGLQPC